MEQCGLCAAKQDGQTWTAGSLSGVQTKHKIELALAQPLPRPPIARRKLAFASVPLQVLLRKEEQLRTVAYEKNSDLVGIIHWFPEITSNRSSPNKPDPVSHHSHQQYDPPECQLNSHPEFPLLKAPRFRENPGSGDEHDI